MILDCGPTLVERAQANRERLSQWHEFFCIWPRRIGNRCAFLHTIRRKVRFEPDYYSGGFNKYPEYRFSLADELKMPPP